MKKLLLSLICTTLIPASFATTIGTVKELVLNDKEFSQKFNQVVENKIRQDWEMLAELGIEVNEDEVEQTLCVRQGQCGNSSEAVFNYIQQSAEILAPLKTEIGGYQVKDTAGGNHIYLKAVDETANILIEPTYHQFLFTKDLTLATKKAIKSETPSVFIGTKEELFQLVEKLHQKYPQEVNSREVFVANYENEQEYKFKVL